jgi:hypothetical protein
MEKFEITNPEKFNGVAALYYRDDILCMIDCRDTDMKADAVRAFKRAVPSSISELKAGGNFSPGTIVCLTGFRIHFDDFWRAYNKKINKLRAEKLYNALKDAETVQCYDGIKKYDQFLYRLNGKREKLDPENYLKNRAWENDWK